jgi:hypothetical protein
VLTVRDLRPDEAAPLFPDGLDWAGVSPAEWVAGCEAGLFLVFAAERDGTTVAFAVAGSGPRVLLVLALVGDRRADRMLLDRAVRVAGEREVAVYCPDDDPALVALLRRRGFARVSRSDPFLYCLARDGGP